MEYNVTMIRATRLGCKTWLEGKDERDDGMRAASEYMRNGIREGASGPAEGRRRAAASAGGPLRCVLICLQAASSLSLIYGVQRLQIASLLQ